MLRTAASLRHIEPLISTVVEAHLASVGALIQQLLEGWNLASLTAANGDSRCQQSLIHPSCSLHSSAKRSALATWLAA